MAETIIILNAGAGAIRDQQPAEVEAVVRQAFEGHAATVQVELAESEGFIGAIDRAVASKASTLIVGGGDGSVGYAARKLAGTDRCLGVLPLGTLNLLARSLGIPADLQPALDALSDAAPRRIDLGAVNGRIFHTLAGLGYFAEVARARAQVRDVAQMPFGRYIAAARAVFRGFTRAGVLKLALEAEAGRREIETYALFVSNNRLAENGFGRPRLDEGVLELHYAEGADFSHRMQAGIDLIAGRWRENPAIESLAVHRFTVSSHRPRLWLSIDGELARVKTPLKFESLPAALTVLAP